MAGYLNLNFSVAGIASSLVNEMLVGVVQPPTGQHEPS